MNDVAARGGVEPRRVVDGLFEGGDRVTDAAPLESERLVERPQDGVARVGGGLRVDDQGGGLGEATEANLRPQQAAPRLEALWRQRERRGEALAGRTEITEPSLEQRAAPLVKVGQRQRRHAAGGDRLRDGARRAGELAGRVREPPHLVLEPRAGPRDQQRALAWLCAALPLAGTS